MQRPLRAYQLEVARAVLQSIDARDGLSFTVLMPRQAGKNELSAQLEAFLLTRSQNVGGSLVKAAPTYKPQTENSIRRIKEILDNPLTAGKYSTPGGYVVQIGKAAAYFFSAAATANVVGGTASLLLEGDEAQDLDATKWDKDFRPMASTGNATTVLYGTPWVQDDLLATSIAANREAEARDGRRRHFSVSWERVAEANPDYGRYVESEIARLGRAHPIIRTQYLLEMLEQAGGFLSETQIALLQGDHPPLERPPAPSEFGSGDFVAGVDVAGADEEDPDGILTRVNQRRDSTALTIAHAERRRVDGLVVEPQLRIVAQYAWRGTPHRVLYPQVLELVRSVWQCSSVVVDASGIGSGMAAYLGAALGPQIVTPYVYTAATKSKLAYDLLSAINAGRLKLYAPRHHLEIDALRAETLDQARNATYELRANQLMLFSVPEHRGHDDLLNSLALVVQAGGQPGRLRTAAGRRQGRGSGKDEGGVLADRQSPLSRR
ncbi:MAG: hypothetical protein IT201_14640 [Thermoleophilia bacterium]|nr:hypothetical protein [Thermoleophilia bacterium]